jgi:hypothetical protein
MGPIKLGRSNSSLQGKDVSRALLWAECVYKPRGQAEALLSGREHNFENVHMSDERSAQSFLVAYAEDAIFVAFRGSTDLVDLATNSQTNEHFATGGSYHKGFYERTKVFVGDDYSALPGLLDLAHKRNPRARLIFCGHSLGGAVASLVLLRMLLELQRGWVSLLG